MIKFDVLLLQDASDFLDILEERREKKLFTILIFQSPQIIKNYSKNQMNISGSLELCIRKHNIGYWHSGIKGTIKKL